MKLNFEIEVAIAILCCIISSDVESQVTYYKDIEPIIIENCTACHSPSGSAPFSLMTFKDVSKRATFIKYVTETRYMPPWKANSEYRSFANDKRLKGSEIELIKQWVRAGAPAGKRKHSSYQKKKKPGQENNGSDPDLVLKMSEPFLIPGNNEQTYICYKIPYELPSDTFVNAIDFIPGNRKLVHHASYQVLAVSPNVDRYSSPDYFIYGDSDYVNDQHDYGKLGLIDKMGKMPLETFHSGWLPGSTLQRYPEGTGFFLPKNGVFLIRNLHYAPTPVEDYDQSSIELHYSPVPIDRKVLFRGFAPINPKPSEPWIIPADSVKTFHINVNIGSDISLLSVNPHMHLLGKYFKAYVLTPKGDSIPIVEIEDWDFNWQEFYHFKQPLHIPKGSFLKAVATYDNTSGNNQNPFNPPRDVYFERGMDDKDEMMRLVFLFMSYRKGDEELKMNNQ